MRLVVIGGWAATRGVVFSAVSACLCHSAHHSNMAIGPVIFAVGNDALTMENFTVFGLMVMYEPFKNKGVSIF